jgi:hypothetical protein
VTDRPHFLVQGQQNVAEVHTFEVGDNKNSKYSILCKKEKRKRIIGIILLQILQLFGNNSKCPTGHARDVSHTL